MSIESQRTELLRGFSDQAAIEIVEVIEEAKSAKSPGRHAFNRMIERIERGEAEGILAWAPDRLARNSIDGGRIVYLLDTGVLKDMKFSSYTFENNSQGKFMLAIMFGQSKYYSDALSDNVKRGLRTKIEKGWRPARPPIGYVTDPVTRTFVPDPVRFPLVQRMFELAATGDYSVKQIAHLARTEWGFRMPDNRRSRGGPIGASTVYRLIKNPIYAGSYLWTGQVRHGQHEPAVSETLFARAQAALKLDGKPRPQRHFFTYTGLIRCGACGLMITAEERVKPSGKRYRYYHCTKRALGPRCPEPAVSEGDLQEQVEAFVRSITIHFDVAAAIEAVLAQLETDRARFEAAKMKSTEAALTDVERQSAALTQLRLRGLIEDDEFIKERNRLALERPKLEALLKRAEEPFELVRAVLGFNKYAAKWFSEGTEAQRRAIFKIAGSNPTLSGKKLSVCAAKPFQLTLKMAAIPLLCGLRNDVRTGPLDSLLEELHRCVEEISKEEDLYLLTFTSLGDEGDTLPLAA